MARDIERDQPSGDCYGEEGVDAGSGGTGTNREDHVSSCAGSKGRKRDPQFAGLA